MSIRCLIAIELPEEVKEALASAVDVIRPELFGVRWTRPESLHLTLKFLGDVDEERVPAVEDAIGTIVLPPPLTLGLHGLGGFPSSDRARVVWAGLQGDLEGLLVVRDRAEDALEKAGFEGEARSFHPHITLARARKTPVVVANAPVEPVTFEAGTLSLIQSQLNPARAIYTTLHAWTFSPV